MYVKGLTIMQSFYKAGDIKQVFQLHKEMLMYNFQPSFVTYNILINGTCLYGDLKDVDMLLDTLRDYKISLTKVTYTSVTKAYCRKSDVHRAVEISYQMVENGFA